jgi:hypothetical protein
MYYYALYMYIDCSVNLRYLPGLPSFRGTLLHYDWIQQLCFNFAIANISELL